MKLKLYLNKSLEKNAEMYFEKAKKLKKKLKGAREALEKSKKKLNLLLIKKEKQEKISLEKEKLKQIKTEKIKKTRKWYHKFHWFVSSEGFLCVGGRDATSNEILIKKQTQKNDLVFHTELAGSPFFVIKNPDNKKIGKNTMEEAAAATASFSRAWRQGISIADVYHITPEQVSKSAKSGEAMAKGSFVIYGKRTYYRAKLEMAVGITKEDIVMSGPVDAIKKNCVKHVLIIQGKHKKGAIAKKIKARIKAELDDIIAALPAGGCAIKKQLSF